MGLDFLESFDTDIASMDEVKRFNKMMHDKAFKERVRKSFRLEAPELRDTGVPVKIIDFDPETSTATGGSAGIVRLNADIIGGTYRSIIVLNLTYNFENSPPLMARPCKPL